MTETKFKPVGAFRTKMFIYILTIFTAITLGIIILGGFITVVSSFDSDPEDEEFANWIADPESQATFFTYYLGLSLLWIIPALILVPLYYNSIKYVLKKDEIIIHKGIINKTVKHIPFRTITNVSSRYGPYDAVLGIGTIEIETAGKSGQMAPEGKIEGIRNYFETRDIILDELRKFKTPYTTGTEISLTEDVSSSSGFYSELLKEIREIKLLIKND